MKVLKFCFGKKFFSSSTSKLPFYCLLASIVFNEKGTLIYIILFVMCCFKVFFLSHFLIFSSGTSIKWLNIIPCLLVIKASVHCFYYLIFLSFQIIYYYWCVFKFTDPFSAISKLWWSPFSEFNFRYYNSVLNFFYFLKFPFLCQNSPSVQSLWPLLPSSSWTYLSNCFEILVC